MNIKTLNNKLSLVLTNILLQTSTCHKKVAFTLAEVLITLGIIGIVAALTLPALIMSYEKMVLKNQFKKVYSAISQTIPKVKMDMGEEDIACYYHYPENSPDWDYATTSDCTYFYDELFKNYNTIKVCKGNAVKDGCIPENYFKYMTISGCQGYNKNNIETRNSIYITSDGALFMPYQVKNPTPILLIDVNGTKKPNIIGKDIFSLVLIKDNYNGYITFYTPRAYVCLYLDENAYFKTLSDLLN